MKKNKKYREDLLDVAAAGFILGVSFTVFLIKSIIDSNKKTKLKTS
jgi:hypothetical protein